MSYYNQPHYVPQPPPPPPPPPPPASQSPPQQEHEHSSGQYQPMPQYGGHTGQYVQPRQTYYPAQPQYQPVGGASAQQMPATYQDSYQTPGVASSSGYAPTTYQYNPAQYSPNPSQQYSPVPPQQYSPHSPQPHQQPVQAYNPQAYASFNQTPNLSLQATTNPGRSHFGSVSGPVDPWAFAPSPGGLSSSSYNGSNSLSPNIPYGSQYGSQPPTPQHNHLFQSSPQVPQHANQYSSATAMPVPETYQPQNSAPSASAGPDGQLGRQWASSPPYGAVDHQNAPSPLYQVSPSGSTPGPTPPAHGQPHVTSLERHPTNRPLPSHPTEPSYFSGGQTYSSTYDHMRNNSLGLTQDELFDDVEAALLGTGRPSIIAATNQNGHTLHNEIDDGHMSSGTVQPRGSGRHDSSGSDAEAAQGLRMLRLAEEEEKRRQSSSGQTPFSGYGVKNDSRPGAQQSAGSDSDDYVNLDMSSFGGGYDVQMTYGGDPSQLAARGQTNGNTHAQVLSSQRSSITRSHPSQSSREGYDQNYDSMHPFPPFNAPARVDAGGTGGLSEPTGRRQSFDEGDEYMLMDNSGTALPERFPDEPPDIEFKPASSTFRPLPAPPYPQNSTSYLSDTISPTSSEFKNLPPVPGTPSYPDAPDLYTVNAQGQVVPRSSSLGAYSQTPQVVQPLRSKTAAEERKARQQQFRTNPFASLDSAAVSTSMLVDLPAIGKRFLPHKLTQLDFDECREPWALSSLLEWLLLVTKPEQNTEVKESDVKAALVAIFTNKIPTMNIIDAESLSEQVVSDLYETTTLVATEEWVRLHPGPISGVIFQLTQSGCYSGRGHDDGAPNRRCYSYHCQRTNKRVNLLDYASRTSESWAEFYGLQKEDLENRDKKEMEKQNVLHEIVCTEEGYMESLDTLRILFRDQLATIEPSVISPKRKDKFLRDVFGRVDAVKQANEEHLLPQLKYRQQEQGPWIVGFSDVFRQWIRKAKSAYIDYATDFPRADHFVRLELERNMEFRAFVEKARGDKRSNRLSLDSFLKAPIARLQRYALLLGTVLKTMKQDSTEKTNLQIALDEVKAVTLECDGRVAEMQRKIDLLDLSSKLVIRPQLKNDVELNLDHFGRELIYRGDLQRMGSTRFSWLDCHALLFDHYLVISKIIVPATDSSSRGNKYDVSRMPIPMDLLILDSANEPIYIKSITHISASSGRTAAPAEQMLGRTPSNQAVAPGNLSHVNTGSSANSIPTLQSLNEKDTERILYPFKVKHLGKETYTLFAPSEQARREWCLSIVEAKTKHAAALHAQHAEPFRLRVMADSAFVMDSFGGAGKGVTITGTPVDRAIKEVEHRFRDTGRPGPICRARVNCATTFTTPHPSRQMVAVGTDYGVYISELDNPRGWERAIPLTKVTQVTVLEEFNLFLLISERSLIAYHLDVICPNDRSGPTMSTNSTRHAPQKLSGSRDVGFFVTGRMKDRTLVFYKKKEGLNSVFKVLEPVYHKSSEKKRGIFKRGTTEFFRDFDEFYIPADSSGINLFHSSLAVSTTRGFEVLTLDKKQSYSVPELQAEHVQNIAASIKDQKALSMLRLSDQEFLLCYERNAVYVNKHGDVSRSVIMDFVGSNAQAAALYGPYLVLFNDDFVEVRNAQNGRLKQIIAGREVKCLDDGTCWPPGSGGVTAGTGLTNGMVGGVPAVARTLKLVMQHPEMERTQIIVELLLNENMKD